MNQIQQLDSLSECHACVTPFHYEDIAVGTRSTATSDRIAKSNKELAFRLPSKSKACDHRVCHHCLLYVQALWDEHATLSSLSTILPVIHQRQNFVCIRQRRGRCLPCPCCHEPQAFDSKRPVIDFELCHLLRTVQGDFRKALLDMYQRPHAWPLGIWPWVLAKVDAKLQLGLDPSNLHVSVLHDMIHRLCQVDEFYGSSP